jgi:hypothetical protein
MGSLFSGIAMGFVVIMAVAMNWRQMVLQKQLALTTSTALTIVGFAGILCGQGHIFTPVVVGVVTAALLAWKQPISGFVGGLSDNELRSAILLAVLSFVIFPVLPAHPVDPWGLIEPQSNWASVIIIAAIGFVNYILMKLLGPRGMEITAFFGGLVNSRKVVVELASRLRKGGTEPISVGLPRDYVGDGGNGSTQRSHRPCSGFASGYGMRHTADPHAVNQRCAVATLPRASKCRGNTLVGLGVSIQTFRSSKIWVDFFGSQCGRRPGSA